MRVCVAGGGSSVCALVGSVRVGRRRASGRRQGGRRALHSSHSDCADRYGQPVARRERCAAAVTSHGWLLSRFWRVRTGPGMVCGGCASHRCVARPPGAPCPPLGPVGRVRLHRRCEFWCEYTPLPRREDPSSEFRPPSVCCMVIAEVWVHYRGPQCNFLCLPFPPLIQLSSVCEQNAQTTMTLRERRAVARSMASGYAQL